MRKPIAALAFTLSLALLFSACKASPRQEAETAAPEQSAGASSSAPSSSAAEPGELAEEEEFLFEMPEEDYVIQWKHDYMEEVARGLTGITGDILRSDLLDITYLYFRGGSAGSTEYSFETDEYDLLFSTDEPISDLDDLEHFQGLLDVRIELENVTDITGIAGLVNAREAMLSFHEDTADLRPIGCMTSLRSLMLWGTDYYRVKSVGFFKNLRQLETLFFIGTGVTDGRVFCTLPNLGELYMNASPELDRQPLIDCESIHSLMLNTVQIRNNGVAEEREDEDDSYSPIARVEKITDNTKPVPFEVRDGWYLVKKPEDLAHLGQLIADQVTFDDGVRAQNGQYRMAGDLDLAALSSGEGGWKPIGEMVWGGVAADKQYIAFSGVFDGGGHTITGLKIDLTTDDIFTGLFGYIVFAEIRNLNIRDCAVSGGTNTGAVAGGNWSYHEMEEVVVKNCHVTGVVSGNTGTGGVIGTANTVEDCSFSGTVTTKGSEYGNAQGVGGVAGRAGAVNRCRSDADVSGHWMVGGVVGSVLRISHCYSLGKVRGDQEAGGVAGDVAQITGCYFGGAVEGYEAVGGVIGSVATKYNIEASPVQGRMKGLVMAGHSIAEIDMPSGEFYEMESPVARLCGSVGSDAGTDEVFARTGVQMKLKNKKFLDNYYYDGEDITDSVILDGSIFTRCLLPEDGKDAWKPIKAGEYPQLAWETAPATKISFQ